MTRKIERHDALDRALTVFWAHGYRGTSMEMLTAALGVEKPSIYASFGSKKALYLAALARYREELLEMLGKRLADAASPRAGIERTLQQLMTPDHRRHRRGCFATNTALELAEHDPEIRESITASFSAFIDAFADAIRRAQAAGEARTDVPAAALARLMVNAVEGVRVLEKTGVPEKTARIVAGLTIGLLDAPAAKAA